MRLVEVEPHGDVAVLRLNRPEKLNALSVAMEADLLSALDSPTVSGSRALVIAGSGRAFSAGADLSEVREMDAASILAYYRGSGRVYEAVAAMPQPTLSAIHGHCLGGGFELALATDFRIADETASFGCPEVKLGIVPSSGGLLRLVRSCGPARARELVLLGRRLGADEAAAMGLVTEVAPAGEAGERALELARELAALPPAALEVAKRTIDVVTESSAAATLLIERLAYATLNHVSTGTGTDVAKSDVQ